MLRVTLPHPYRRVGTVRPPRNSPWLAVRPSAIFSGGVGWSRTSIAYLLVFDRNSVRRVSSSYVRTYRCRNFVRTRANRKNEFRTEKVLNIEWNALSPPPRRRRVTTVKFVVCSHNGPPSVPPPSSSRSVRCRASVPISHAFCAPSIAFFLASSLPYTYRRHVGRRSTERITERIDRDRKARGAVRCL